MCVSENYLNFQQAQNLHEGILDFMITLYLLECLKRRSLSTVGNALKNCENHRDSSRIFVLRLTDAFYSEIDDCDKLMLSEIYVHNLAWWD